MEVWCVQRKAGGKLGRPVDDASHFCSHSHRIMILNSSCETKGKYDKHVFVTHTYCYTGVPRGEEDSTLIHMWVYVGV